MTAMKTNPVPPVRHLLYSVLGTAACLIAAGMILSPGLAARLLLAGALIGLGYAACLIAAFVRASELLSYRMGTSEAAHEEYVRDTRRTISDEKISVINKFSSIVSHELKNPLASLKNIAFYLTRAAKFEDERSKKMLDMLSSEIDRANQMINELLDMSRVKKIAKKPSQLNELIESSISEAALDGAIRVTRDISPIEAEVDPDRFKQIIMNLLTNARDAMPQGGEITVSLKAEKENAVIVFKDTGTGMEPDVLARIFEPLFTTKTKVLGFGLTLVKQIVAMHNGTIEAASEKGRGTTFHLILPLH